MVPSIRGIVLRLSKNSHGTSGDAGGAEEGQGVAEEVAANALAQR